MIAKCKTCGKAYTGANLILIKKQANNCCVIPVIKEQVVIKETYTKPEEPAIKKVGLFDKLTTTRKKRASKSKK